MVSTTPAVLWSNDEYEIRPAKSNDEYRSMWWRFMRELGWNRGYYDLDTYMNVSRGSGMLLLLHKPSAQPVGHVAAVINSNKTGWISMFIIDGPHRGKGLGAELFKCAMADFERGGTEIRGLDGVVEQRATYERRGFVDSPLGLLKLMMRPLVDKEPLTGDDASAKIDGHLVGLASIPRHLLAQHELRYTGFERPQLWSDELMFNRPDVTGVALTRTETPQSLDDLRGWALIRRSLHGPRIGPLYADSVVTAKAVLARAMAVAIVEYVVKAKLPDDPFSESSATEVGGKAMLVAEVWGGNPAAVKMFEDLGWKDAGVSYHRMWVDDKATPEFSEGGAAQRGVFAVFDAAIG